MEWRLLLLFAYVDRWCFQSNLSVRVYVCSNRNVWNTWPRNLTSTRWYMITLSRSSLSTKVIAPKLNDWNFILHKLYFGILIIHWNLLKKPRYSEGQGYIEVSLNKFHVLSILNALVIYVRMVGLQLKDILVSHLYLGWVRSGTRTKANKPKARLQGEGYRHSSRVWFPKIGQGAEMSRTRTEWLVIPWGVSDALDRNSKCVKFHFCRITE